MEPQETHWNWHSYEKEVIDAVWDLGLRVTGNDAALWRKDEHGAWIHRLEYGNRHSQFGWEIYDPSEAGNGFGLAALRPLQWQNYQDAIAFSPNLKVSADGLQNRRRLGD